MPGSPDLVIFDEPTSVLTPQEAESLFTMMQSLVAGGKSICFITHKLDEVMSIAIACHRAAGRRVIDTLETRQTNPRELARKMVGREVIFSVQKPACRAGRCRSGRAGHRDGGAPGQTALRDISLAVRQGEILGVAGISGNGQNELAEAIAGLRPVLSGSIRIVGA